METGTGHINNITDSSFSRIPIHDICFISLYLDVRGSVRHSILHIKNPTKCNIVSTFYFIFI